MRLEQAEELFVERVQLIDDLAFQEPDSLEPVVDQDCYGGWLSIHSGLGACRI